MVTAFFAIMGIMGFILLCAEGKGCLPQVMGLLMFVASCWKFRLFKFQR